VESCITIYNKDGTNDGYSPVGRNPEWLIPAKGSFKKEATVVTDIKNVKLFNIVIHWITWKLAAWEY